MKKSLFYDEEYLAIEAGMKQTIRDIVRTRYAKFEKDQEKEIRKQFVDMWNAIQYENAIKN